MTARTRNLIAFLATLAAVLVAFDYMTGGEWAQFVALILRSLVA